MPWEAKRWVLFVLLMVAMSLYALLYQPEQDAEPGGTPATSTGEAAGTGTAGRE